MKLIRVCPECCDKCLSTCLEFRLKIEGCAIRGYDIDFNITQVCTEYHKNQTKITPPVPRKAAITKMPAIPEVEEQITPVVTKIGPYAIKKTGVQKLIVTRSARMCPISQELLYGLDYLASKKYASQF
ncbi:hypothetical protein DUI87_13620 [Hirundo rustica rustica]|uniref:Uncharacterized protein n=1 Tax=Hirundo rustica rustica TaxID=333673 RepID=A0A3M0K9G5_HIRRU|nr:hypothetical protein DUI87_13620 [Hirundo rustica rustica]